MRRRIILFSNTVTVTLGGCTQVGLFTLLLIFWIRQVLTESRSGARQCRRQQARRLPARAFRVQSDRRFFFGGGWDTGDKASYKFVGVARWD